MKTGGKAQGLPSLSDLVQPRASAPGAAPVPKGPPTGSFAVPAGAERRFSARFLQGIEPRMMRTGLPAERCAALARHFGAMNRSELDREGRVVDGLLAGAHPKESMAVYAMLCTLGALVTKSGARATANAEGSWTIQPPGQDAVVLPDVAGQRHGDFAVERAGLLVASTGLQVASGVSRNLEAIGKDVVLTSVAVLATSADALPLTAALSALTQAKAVGPLARATGTVLADLGPDATAEPLGVGAAVTVAMAAVAVVATMPRGEVDGLKKLLDLAGKSAAPSTRCDPAAERAVLLARLAVKGAGAPADLERFAADLRGLTRAGVLQALRGM